MSTEYYIDVCLCVEQPSTNKVCQEIHDDDLNEIYFDENHQILYYSLMHVSMIVPELVDWNKDDMYKIAVREFASIGIPQDKLTICYRLDFF